MDPDPAPDPAIFVSDLQEATNNYFFLSFLLFTFRRYRTFTSFFEDKKSSRIQKTVGSKVFLATFAW
jgi:hypothetical protein